jgi:hypothetical protein
VNERRLIVVGTLASKPYAGMAWMHMQFAVGLHFRAESVLAKLLADLGM